MSDYMRTYKAALRARHRELTWREQFLDYNENPFLFLLFSWKFHFYGKVFKHYIKLPFLRRNK